MKRWPSVFFGGALLCTCKVSFVREPGASGMRRCFDGLQPRAATSMPRNRPRMRPSKADTLETWRVKRKRKRSRPLIAAGIGTEGLRPAIERGGADQDRTRVRAEVTRSVLFAGSSTQKYTPNTPARFHPPTAFLPLFDLASAASAFAPVLQQLALRMSGAAMVSRMPSRLFTSAPSSLRRGGQAFVKLQDTSA